MLKAEDLVAALPSDIATDLELGLDVIEYLAKQQLPKTPIQIAENVNLSVFELSHLLRALEKRDYIFKTGKTGGYTVTAKVHTIGLVAPYVQQLLANAPAIMSALSEDVLQSCNLSIPFNANMVVIAQSHSPANFNINVPIGFQHDAALSAAGLVFAAFDRYVEGPGRIGESTLRSEISASNDVGQIVGQGFAQAEGILDGVPDLSCPIFYGSKVVATLTVPYLKSESSMGLERCLDTLLKASSTLSSVFCSGAFRAVSSH